MSFSPGQRVRMKRTENYGEVTRVLPGGLYQVKLDGGLGHIPIPEEALESAAPTPAPPPEPKSKPEEPDKNWENAPQGEGIQLAFDAQLNNMAEPEAYEIYLLNDTPHKIIYELKVFTGQDRRWSKTGQLEGKAKKRLDVVAYRWLNEKLSCELDVRAVLKGGTGARHFQKVRIKGRQFFDRLTEVPALYREAHLYSVFPQISATRMAPAAAPRMPSLKAITLNEVRKQSNKQVEKQLVQTDLQAKLEFQEELDLHLDKLVSNPESVPKHQVLPTQMMYFDNYIDQALRLGVDQVFIIHGVGNGVLKKAIQKRLESTPFIKKVIQEYHPKYGYGATEVHFD